MSYPGAVKGISIAPSGDVAVSCSTDCSVRLFRLPFAPFMAAGPVEDEAVATLEFQGKHAFRGIDHHWTRTSFATAGQQVTLGHCSRFWYMLVLWCMAAWSLVMLICLMQPHACTDIASMTCQLAFRW